MSKTIELTDVSEQGLKEFLESVKGMGIRVVEFSDNSRGEGWYEFVDTGGVPAEQIPSWALSSSVPRFAKAGAQSEYWDITDNLKEVAWWVLGAEQDIIEDNRRNAPLKVTVFGVERYSIESRAAAAEEMLKEKYWNDKTFEEIGEQFGMPVVAVRESINATYQKQESALNQIEKMTNGAPFLLHRGQSDDAVVMDWDAWDSTKIQVNTVMTNFKSAVGFVLEKDLEPIYASGEDGTEESLLPTELLEWVETEGWIPMVSNAMLREYLYTRDGEELDKLGVTLVDAPVHEKDVARVIESGLLGDAELTPEDMSQVVKLASKKLVGLQDEVREQIDSAILDAAAEFGIEKQVEDPSI